MIVPQEPFPHAYQSTTLDVFGLATVPIACPAILPVERTAVVLAPDNIPDLDPRLVISNETQPPPPPHRAAAPFLIGSDLLHSTPEQQPAPPPPPPSSLLTTGPGLTIPQPTYKHLKGAFKDSLPTRVQVTLDQKFGKDNLNQSFTADVCFRHILLPLFKSNLLSPREQGMLVRASKPANVLRSLLSEHSDIDFSPCEASTQTGTQSLASTLHVFV